MRRVESWALRGRHDAYRVLFPSSIYGELDSVQGTYSNISKQVTLADAQAIHVTRIVSSRPILHRVAQIACSSFHLNQLLADPVALR